MKPASFEAKLVAPCGINCGICRAYLRKNNPCLGCNFAGEKPKTRAFCRIRLCAKRTGSFCCNCPEFPCDDLKRLDARYRRRYGISEIDNLVQIRDHGIDAFILEDEKRWISDRGILCVHDRKYYEPRSG